MFWLVVAKRDEFEWLDRLHQLRLAFADPPPGTRKAWHMPKKSFTDDGRRH